MHDIYYFNGQDIAMSVCIQIHRVINLIQEQEKIDFEEATGRFYHSQTYKTLTQVENGFNDDKLLVDMFPIDEIHSLKIGDSILIEDKDYKLLLEKKLNDYFYS